MMMVGECVPRDLKGDLKMRKTEREIRKIEKRMEWIAFALVVIGILAMWAFIGYQLNLLEGMH